MTIPGWIDFGMWAAHDGRRGLVTWSTETGQLQWLGPRRLELLAVIKDEDELRRRLEGWADAILTEDIDWIRRQVAPESCPTCHGEGWVQSNWDDGASQVACWCQMESAL